MDFFMPTQAYLNQISTTVPAYECHQKFTQVLPALLPLPEARQKLEHVIARLGISQRYTVLENLFGVNSESFYSPGHFPSTETRMKTYQKEALPLALKAIQPLLEKLDPQSITHLLVTSCTGFYAPGIDIDIVRECGLMPSVERSLIGFMGCYAAISALRLARHIVKANPNAKVLMVNIELCSLHWREDVPFDQLVSFLLFADGAAASLISAEASGLRLDESYTAFFPDTLDLMRWTISDQGFYMKLDSQIPSALHQSLQAYEKQIFHGRARRDFQLWGIHPGGRSILDAAQAALEIPESEMHYSRSVLNDYGNMSSPTVMFVLKRILEDKTAHGFGSTMAFGPGLTLESFVFEKEKAA